MTCIGARSIGLTTVIMMCCILSKAGVTDEIMVGIFLSRSPQFGEMNQLAQLISWNRRFVACGCQRLQLVKI